MSYQLTLTSSPLMRQARPYKIRYYFGHFLVIVNTKANRSTSYFLKGCSVWAVIKKSQTVCCILQLK